MSVDIVSMAMCKSNDYWEKKVPSSNPKNSTGYTVIFDQH